jgi:hypothetical protein
VTSITPGRYWPAGAASPRHTAAGEQVRHFPPDKPSRSRAGRTAAVPLSEDEVKQGAGEFLEAAGFRVAVAWGHQRGIDIEAVSAADVVLLEATGSAQNPPRQVNYFLSALGELLQRMASTSAAYGLALPDNPQYRGLVNRLPALVWERRRFTVLFVSKDAAGDYTAEPITGPS